MNNVENDNIEQMIPPASMNKAGELPDKKDKYRFPAIQQMLILIGIIGALFAMSSVINALLKQSSTQPWVDVPPDESKIAIQQVVRLNISPDDLIAKHAFVFDIQRQRVLFNKDGDTVAPLASITKLMTALVAHELSLSTSTIYVSSRAWQEQGGNFLRDGTRISIAHLIKLAMATSANDAAHMLAETLSEMILNTTDERVFVEAMNIRASGLNLPTLRFINPHGLDESAVGAGGYGSARDVSFLMAYIYNTYPEILYVTTATSTRIRTEDGTSINIQNTNRIVELIPNLLGSKTGFTDLAGGNLTIIFNAGFQRPIVITVLGSTLSGRFTDIQKLIEAVQSAIEEEQSLNRL